jgi:hypothetical protein
MKKLTMIALTALTIVGAATAASRLAETAESLSSQRQSQAVLRAPGFTADSITNAIVTQADVPVSFKNDDTYPWTIDGDAVKNGNIGIESSASVLSMQYTSTLRTEVSFDWRCYNSYGALYLYVDGVATDSIYHYSYKDYKYKTIRLYLDPGQHIIVFRSSNDNYASTSYFSNVKNVRVKTFSTIENAVLTADSKPLTFNNNGAWPWTIEDGYIQNTNYNHRNSTSAFSTTFTIDKPSKLSFTCRMGYDNDFSSSYNSEHTLRFVVNGTAYEELHHVATFTKYSVVLEPGTYTAEWQDIMGEVEANLFSQIKDIELSDTWIEADLSQAGTLGVEVLYLVNVLSDVEMLKVKGAMNSADWATIKQMTNLVAIDLSEASFAALPNSAFDGMTTVRSVKLPEGITSIGYYAFRGTRITDITIPNSVTSIDYGAFISTPVRSVTFGQASSLQFIGYQAFYGCQSLTEFIMPNTVTDFGDSRGDCEVFQGCTNLTRIHFSEALTTIKDEVCYNCSSLSEIELPQNLKVIGNDAFSRCPELRSIDLPAGLEEIGNYAFATTGLDSLFLPVKLTKLGNSAFQYCSNLKYVELPSYVEQYYSTFYNCPSLQTIVSRSATPPAVYSDPFSGNCPAKSTLTLKVPSFAVVNYKLDSYWYQFGSIVEGDDIDYWKISSLLSLANNRRMNGTPDIDLYFGGQLTVGGSAPMPVGQFQLFVNESNPGALVNSCDAMTANKAATRFSADANKWYFLTPLYDVALADIQVSNEASYVFRYYDGQNRAANGTGASWKNVDTGKLNGGQGYIFQCNKACEITFPANATGGQQLLTTSDVTRSLSAYVSEVSANKNWNYVGNPYPCYYDIYYMDFSAPITVWTGSTYKAYSIADDEFALRPMQSFFVQKPAAVDNIVFHKEGRQLTAEINHMAARAYRSQTQANRFFFNLQLLGDELSDETRVVVNSEASLSYELECDASKFMSFESAVPQLFTLDAEGNGYAINERPLDNGQVRLAYYVGQAGFYTITASRAEGDVYLYDAQTGKTVNLSEQDYTFHSDATNGNNTTRFVLTFKVNSNETTSISEDFCVKNEKTAAAPVYNLKGQRVVKATKGVFVQNGKKVVRQ